jgi:hypothetical protein
MLVRAFIIARGSIGRWSYMAGVGGPWGRYGPGDLVDLPYWPVDRDTWDVARGD